MTYDEIETSTDAKALADLRRRLYPKLFGAPSPKLTEAQNKYQLAGSRLRELADEDRERGS